jgi:hypothetical protein
LSSTNEITQAKTEHDSTALRGFREVLLMNINKKIAVTIATELLEAEGKEVDNYDVSVSHDNEEWEVAFVGKHPRPPGNEIYVYVNKLSGATRTMYGE